jgi:hypothetical protein
MARITRYQSFFSSICDGGIFEVHFRYHSSDFPSHLYITSLGRKMCSGSKMKEMTGSGIFGGSSETDNSDASSGATNPPNKTTLRMYQVCLYLACCK